MAQVPLQFNAITCKHCGAIVALLPPGACIHTMHLRCGECSAVTTIKIIDNKQRKAYTSDLSAGTGSVVRTASGRELTRGT